MAPDVGRESHSCFRQVRDRSGQVSRCRHIASNYAHCCTTHDGLLLRDAFSGQRLRAITRAFLPFVRFVAAPSKPVSLLPCLRGRLLPSGRSPSRPLLFIVSFPFGKTKRSTGPTKTRRRKDGVQLTSTREKIKGRWNPER